ncbi:hypothetical protein LTS18_004727, partial [Coniosporium uncinatum]
GEGERKQEEEEDEDDEATELELKVKAKAFAIGEGEVGWIIALGLLAENPWGRSIGTGCYRGRAWMWDDKSAMGAHSPALEQLRYWVLVGLC